MDALLPVAQLASTTLLQSGGEGKTLTSLKQHAWLMGVNCRCAFVATMPAQ